MVFNATFNNISVISCQSVLLVEETGIPRENHRHVASHWQTLLHNAVHLTQFKIRTSVVIGTDCTGSCKSNYHTITTTMAPYYTLVTDCKNKMTNHRIAFFLTLPSFCFLHSNSKITSWCPTNWCTGCKQFSWFHRYNEFSPLLSWGTTAVIRPCPNGYKILYLLFL